LKRTVLLVFIFLLLFGFSEQAFAKHTEEHNQEELLEMDIEELMEMEIEVETVTTATKTSTKVTDAPSSITVITAEEIRKYGWRSLADILRSVKGFYTSYDRHYERIGVRGFSLPGDENTRVLILVDGFRMNENVRGHGGIGHEFLLDTDLIDRVEIVRGPGSALYGSNAIFGVINIITKKGADYDGFEFSGDMFSEKFTSFEAQRGRITYGTQFDNGLDWLVSSTLSSQDGRMLYFRHWDNRDEPIQAGEISPPDGLTSNDEEFFQKFFTKLTLDEFTLEAGYSRRSKEIPTAPLGSVFEPQFHHWKYDTQAFMGLTYKHDFSDTSNILARLSYNAYNHRRKLHFWSEQWSEWETLGYASNPEVLDRKGTWWNGEVQYTHQPIENHTLTWGVEFQYNGRQDIDVDRATESAIEIPDPCDPCDVIVTGFNRGVEQTFNAQKNSRSWGFYVQDEYKVSDTLTLSAGVRYDDIQGALARDTINPRFAVINKWSDATTLKLLYGTAFRSPTIKEVFYPDEDDNEQSGLAQASAESRGGLDSETIETYEVVLEHYFKPNIRGSLSIFHYKIHDFINQASNYGQPTHDLRWTNWGMAQATGMELGLEGKSQSGIWARASYSLTDTEYGAGIYNSVWDAEEEMFVEGTGGVAGYDSERMVNSPLHLAKLNVIVPVVKDKIFAGFEAQYNSRRKTLYHRVHQTRPKTNDYLLANLTITAVDVMKNMDVSFGIYNLFNTRYYHPAWGDNELDSIEQNGRSFLFNLRYRF
jgi:iron complex outermembrane receptor protein